MLKFIQLLTQRYQAIIANQKNDDSLSALYQQRVEQLLFTESFIRKGELISSSAKTPLQIAIIGPTQAGKSTIINLVLNDNSAGVSPLAGYTVHPQGFCCHTTVQACSGLQNYFGRFQQLTQSELSDIRHDCYSLTDNNSDPSLLPQCVFWDTPDFDSIDSADYREGVIRTIALADIVVLVVSKEKYADQSVWEMMAMIESFHQPTLICVNKLIKGTEELITRSLEEKWQKARNDGFPDVVPLFYEKQTAMPDWPSSENDLFFQIQKKVSQHKHPNYQSELINKYWHSWMEPIVAEHQVARLWRALVDETIEQAIKEYQRDYLDHPQYYDTFQNAIVELLALLEFPGISGVLTKTRRVLTWPVRKMMGIGKKIVAPESQEEDILKQIGEHVLISITDQLLGKIDSDNMQNKWWKESYSMLRQQHNSLLDEFNREVERYSTSFQQDVDATANRLYDKLSEHPVILNSLRAARISTDAAAMALIIATGGIGFHDLVITPAMLSVTSLLAESAIGGFMKNAEADLRRHQLSTVKNELFVACIQKSLYALPEQISDKNRFNISQALVGQVEIQRKEKKHGIRIL